MDALRRELTLLVLSHYPLVVLESADEERAEELVTRVATELGLVLARWSATTGLRVGMGMRPDTRDPDRALAELLAQSNEVVALFFDLDPFLERPEVRRRLRDLERAFGERRSTLVLCGPAVALPPPFDTHAVRLQVRLPGQEELRRLVAATARELERRGRARVELPEHEQEQLARALLGLGREEARRVLLAAALEDGVLDFGDLPRVLESKRRRLGREGALEWVEADAGLEQLGGAPNFKVWVERRRDAFSERARRFGLPPPKGVLLAGVPGTGKSLACRSLAGHWQLPLLRLDAGGLYDKFIGESEANLRRALTTAEALAPSVLWIDEIEKGFPAGTGTADAGLSRRLLGGLLTWMQERPAPVFLAATANDIEALPLELIRRGRFDEVFFFDLPAAPERERILALHLTRRQRDPAEFDLPALAQATEGFSGSELEGLVVAGLYHAFSLGRPLTTEILREELRQTRPLAQVRPEAVQRLRRWGNLHGVAA
jgi:hypothetical protein